MLIKIIALIISLDTCRGVLNSSSGSKYTGIPPLFHLDPYKECIQEGGEYCSLRMHLVSDQPSYLLRSIQRYSKRKTHFNHTLLNHGICITKTCKQFLKPNTTWDPRVTLEGCLNKTLWQDYRLQAKLTEEPSCHKAGENSEIIGALDVAIAVLLGIVLVLNLVGTLREFIASEKDNSILSCFSLKRNWQALTGPSRLSDRMDGMKAFSGIRSITSIIVICVHSLMPFVISSSNPRDFEGAFAYLKYVGTGAVIIQTFFAMSGFLLAYHMVADEGARGLGGLQVARRVRLRWLRLAPPYMIVLALMMTWLKFFGPGPMWQTAFGDHLESCRRYWWLVPLNLVNYIDHTQCFVEYWYIGAEMQLSILGLLVVGLLRGRARWWALGALLVAGVVAPAAHTWAQDLDAWMLLTPENSRNFFVQDATFNHVYKRGHTNVAGYVIGVALGLLTFGWQRDNVLKKYDDKLHFYRIIYWCSVPLLFATVFAGSVFFEGTPLPLRVGYSVMARVTFAGGVAVLLAGLTLKIDDVYRSILSWRGWALPARLSYGAYVVHVSLIRLYTGSQTTLHHVSVANALYLFLGAVLASFLVAVPIWLMVEAPVAGLIKHLTRRSPGKPTPCTPTPAPVSVVGSEKSKVGAIASDNMKHVVESL